MYLLKKKLDYINSVESKMTCKDILVVLRFLMYFNVFESTFFDDKKYSKTRNERKQVWERLQAFNDAVRQKINISDYDFFADHFAQRYNEAGNGTNRYRGLKLCYKISDDVLQAITMTSNGRVHSENLIYYYLEICYGFRNNLFHGDKEIENVGEYNREFCCINKFMSLLMSNLSVFDFQEKF